MQTHSTRTGRPGEDVHGEAGGRQEDSQSSRALRESGTGQSRDTGVASGRADVQSKGYRRRDRCFEWPRTRSEGPAQRGNSPANAKDVRTDGRTMISGAAWLVSEKQRPRAALHDFGKEKREQKGGTVSSAEANKTSTHHKRRDEGQ